MIYIIPILLDNCTIPDHLNKFQWIEIDNENLMDEILNSLNLQRQKYLETLSKDQIEINSYSSFYIDLNISIPMQINYSCDLPLFYKNNFFDSQFVNTFIQQKGFEAVSSYRKSIIDSYNEDDMRGAFFLDISHSITQLNTNFLSLTITYDSYYSRCLYPNTNIDTLNFAFNPERRLNLNDMIDYYGYNGIYFKDLLHQLVNELLLKYGNEDQKEYLKRYIEDLTEENINFVFSEEILEINFTNFVPHAFRGLSSLVVPLKKLPKEIIKV